MADTIDGTPPTLNWKIYVGDRNEQQFYITDNNGAVDLSGAEILVQAREEPISPTASLTATVTPSDLGSGHFIVGWDGEEVRALVDSTGTSQWRGVWDLQITESGETLPLTYARGTLSAIYDVTRIT
jgi:hypothetical protein